MVEEIETIETANHWNQLDKKRLESICRNVTNRFPGLDKWRRTCERRIAAVPTDRGSEYLKGRTRDIHEECFAEALATVEPFLNLRGVASSQRRFYSRQGKLESARLHADPAIDGTLRLAELAELGNLDGDGLVAYAERAATGKEWGKLRLVRGEARGRGDKIGHQHASRIDEVIDGVELDDPELKAIGELQEAEFELFERLREIKCGARRFTVRQLEQMTPEAYRAVRERQRQAGVRQ